MVVISFGTPDASRRVQRTLPFCTRKGKWLVLDNCQLLSRWDPEVLQQLDLVLTTPAGQRQEALGKSVSGEHGRTLPYSFFPIAGQSKGGPLEIHPMFRLWLITTLNATDSVPGTAVLLERPSGRGSPPREERGKDVNRERVRGRAPWLIPCPTSPSLPLCAQDPCTAAPSPFSARCLWS